jgi:hypothetical protein
MGCLAFSVGLITPRLLMVVLWLFSNYLSRAYDSWLVPLLGFFILPTTTLAYAVAENEVGGFRKWGAILVIVAVGLDLGLWGGGRGLFSRD